MSKLENRVYDFFQVINAYERNYKNRLTGEVSRLNYQRMRKNKRET